MHLLLAMLYYIIMVVSDGVLYSRKYDSDHRVPRDEMEWALGWAETHGEDWMIKFPKLCPEEVKRESFYRFMLHKHPDKDREWIDKFFPWDNSRFVEPNKEVWDEYWKEKSGEEDYEKDYPWLKWPDDTDEWGYAIPQEAKFKY